MGDNNIDLISISTLSKTKMFQVFSLFYDNLNFLQFLYQCIFYIMSIDGHTPGYFEPFKQ